LWAGYTEAIVGDGEGVCFFEGFSERCLDFGVNLLWQRLVWFVVDAEDLLADFVGPACEEAGLGGSGPRFEAVDAGDVDFFVAEEFEEAVAGLIFTDGGDGKDFGAEGREIVGGIGTATGHDLRFAVLEDEDGGFAGDAGDVAELKGVGYEIAEDDDSFGGEALDDFGEGD